jgi:hypothetical protein
MALDEDATGLEHQAALASSQLCIDYIAHSSTRDYLNRLCHHSLSVESDQ